MAFTKKWAGFISNTARLIFFFLVIFQIPLFRVSCRCGMCSSPLELTSCHLFATEIWPAVVVKSLLYPRAVAKAVLKNKEIPNFNDIMLLYPKIRNFNASNGLIDFSRIEVLVGSYFTVLGALLGCLKPGRMSLAGTLLTLWGLKKELFIGGQTRPYTKEAVSMYPMMLIAIVLAFISIKADVRKLLHCLRRRNKLKYY